MIWGLLRNWIMTSVTCCSRISLPVSSNLIELTWLVVSCLIHVSTTMFFNVKSPQTEVPHGCDQRAHPQTVLEKGWVDFNLSCGHGDSVIWNSCVFFSTYSGFFATMGRWWFTQRVFLASPIQCWIMSGWCCKMPMPANYGQFCGISAKLSPWSLSLMFCKTSNDPGIT